MPDAVGGRWRPRRRRATTAPFRDIRPPPVELAGPSVAPAVPVQQAAQQQAQPAPEPLPPSTPARAADQSVEIREAVPQPQFDSPQPESEGLELPEEIDDDDDAPLLSPPVGVDDALVLELRPVRPGASETKGRELDPRKFAATERRQFGESSKANWEQHLQHLAVEVILPDAAKDVPRKRIFPVAPRFVHMWKGGAR